MRLLCVAGKKNLLVLRPTTMNNFLNVVSNPLVQTIVVRTVLAVTRLIFVAAMSYIFFGVLGVSKNFLLVLRPTPLDYLQRILKWQVGLVAPTLTTSLILLCVLFA